MDGPERVDLLVLQPTPFCNLDCDYCYLPGRDRKNRMSIATVRRVVERLLEDDLVGEELSIVWHAGEPLVAPVSFYREACAVIDESLAPSRRARYSVQTNATLVSGEWCRLFADHRFSVGVSVDGPAFLHDLHRKSRTGKGSHAAAMAGLRLLQEARIPVHAIAVLTRDALAHADAIFEFFVEAGIREVGFNVEELEGEHSSTSLAGESVARQLREFYDRTLERVVASGHALAIREFDALVGMLRSGRRLEMGNDQVLPFKILSVDFSGRFSTFSPELLGARHPRHGDLTFGDVASSSFRGMESNPAFQSTVAEIREGVRRCRESCGYFSVCGGGAPANKLFETGSFLATSTVFCRTSRMMIVDALLGRAHALGEQSRGTIHEVQR